MFFLSVLPLRALRVVSDWHGFCDIQIQCFILFVKLPKIYDEMPIQCTIFIYFEAEKKLLKSACKRQHSVTGRFLSVLSCSECHFSTSEAGYYLVFGKYLE
jgi:hypothetical protein